MISRTFSCFRNVVERNISDARASASQKICFCWEVHGLNYAQHLAINRHMAFVSFQSLHFKRQYALVQCVSTHSRREQTGFYARAPGWCTEVSGGWASITMPLSFKQPWAVILNSFLYYGLVWDCTGGKMLEEGRERREYLRSLGEEEQHWLKWKETQF